MKLALHKKICLGVLCAVLLIFTAFSAIPRQVAYAANTEIKFDETNVLDDLRSSDGFNILDYPFDSIGERKHPEIINVVEYCYSYKINLQSNYGLYLYFYNPQSLDILTDSFANKIQMAVAYKTENGVLVADEYEKFDLQFCSMATESNYYGLFYKFKVIDHESADGKTVLQRLNSNARRYDISGVELHTNGDNNATEYTVGGTYTFTGYAKGYGSDQNAESNLTCDVTELETIQLDVRDAIYRTDSSDLGKYHQNQLNAVYFAVDNSTLEKYGKLQKIKAEWYEYKTAPMIALSDMTVYNAFQPYIGVPLTAEFDTNVPVSLYGAVTERGDHMGAVRFNWSYNGHAGGAAGDFPTHADEKENVLYNILPINSENLDTRYVPKKDLITHFTEYDKTFINGTLSIKNNTMSADLFLSELDEGRQTETVDGEIIERKPGYYCTEIDASETYDLLSYNDSHGFWDKVGDYGLWNALFGGTPDDENITIEPIKEVKTNDMLGDFGKTLLLESSYTAAFENYYNENKKADKTTFLFRFAATDYKAFNVHNNLGSAANDKYNGYYAQETVFFDFDILQLTFNKDGFYHVIPVVASPIDVVGALTPPPVFEKNDWWKIILGILIFILILVLLQVTGLLPLFVQGVIFVITLPFKLLASLFKGISSAVKKSKNKTGS